MHVAALETNSDTRHGVSRESGGNPVERALEVLATIQFLIVGLSHVFQRHAWVEFFIWLRERGHAGVFVHGFLSLWFGSMILAFHDV
jgi:hypothetical protein